MRAPCSSESKGGSRRSAEERKGVHLCVARAAGCSARPAQECGTCGPAGQGKQAG
jgi:hypothetical protein